MATQTIDVRVNDKTRGPLKNISNSLGRLATLAATAFGASAILRQVDAYEQIQNRLKLVTKSTSELTKVQGKLFAVAQSTRQSFGATAELYQKLALNAANLGLSQSELVTITESVNKSIALSGAAGAQAEAGILQLSQAFASGRLAGDEFRSISENIPDLLSRIAVATGKPRGELKKLAAEGKLTGRVLAESILATADGANEKFGKLDITLAQSFTIANNNITKFVGELNNSIGAGATLGRVVIFLTENLGKAVVGAVAFTTALAVGKLVAIARGVGGVGIAFKKLNAIIFPCS